MTTSLARLVGGPIQSGYTARRDGFRRLKRYAKGQSLSSVAHGDDLSARGAMLTGSCLAGMSFTKGLGLVHATRHMIGAVFDTPSRPDQRRDAAVGVAV